MSLVNPNFSNRDLTEIKRRLLGFVRTAAGRYRFKKHLNCVPPDYKMEEAYKGKSCKATVSYISCLSKIVTGAGKK